ncbi:MAG: hypothetical protein IJB81_13325 [Clostridia bacterium]|nr:hypothetical protein [Clostridia bacterium]
MEKNIAVVDEAGNVYEPTWPKRAKGLVKHGRARFVDENRICLTCPPDITEETQMSNPSIFGEMTAADILNRINNIINQTSYITSAFESLTMMGDGDSGDCGAPGNIMGKAKAEAVAEVIRVRESTNQQILRLYEKMYDDLIRLNDLPAQPDGANANE